MPDRSEILEAPRPTFASVAPTGDRAALFAAIDRIGPELAEEVALADQTCRLPPRSLALLREAGLLSLKTPAVLGGREASNRLQFEAIERVAGYSAAGAWCLFIYVDSLGKASSHLPDAGVAALLADGDAPAVCGGGGLLLGTLAPEKGGFRVSGRWIYGSGLAGAQWVMVFAAPAGSADLAQARVLVVAREAVESLENWNVLGLRGTGSADFNITDAFVPEAMSWPLQSPRLRGGSMLGQGLVGYGGHAIPAVTLGVARRVLDEAVRIAEQKARGYGKRVSLAQRGVFQAFVGQADLRLKAARGLVLELADAMMDKAECGGTTPADEAEYRAAGSHAVQETVAIVSELSRLIGGDGIRVGGLFERALRDVHTAATHFTVSNSAYESHGQALLGQPGVDPLA